jgi:hypothetical protein
MPVAGNATVVNLLMRWPLITAATVAAAVVLPPVLPKIEPLVALVSTPSPTVVVPPPPAPVPPLARPVPPSIDVICPPIKDTAKLSKKQKQELKARGCKIKG